MKLKKYTENIDDYVVTVLFFNDKSGVVVQASELAMWKPGDFLADWGDSHLWQNAEEVFGDVRLSFSPYMKARIDCDLYRKVSEAL